MQDFTFSDLRRQNNPMVRVLLVDDSDADTRRFELLLNDKDVAQETDFEVAHAPTLEEAIAMIGESETAGNPYQVILQDLVMPPYVGEELVKAICEVAPNAAVVCLTGVDDRQLRAKVYDAGAVGYMVKARAADMWVDMSQALRDAVLNALETKRRILQAKANGNSNSGNLNSGNHAA